VINFRLHRENIGTALQAISTMMVTHPSKHGDSSIRVHVFMPSCVHTYLRLLIALTKPRKILIQLLIDKIEGKANHAIRSRSMIRVCHLVLRFINFLEWFIKLPCIDYPIGGLMISRSSKIWWSLVLDSFDGECNQWGETKL
jgi:hypothetical protein